jgi:glucose 1-dehydrogenase
MKRTVIFTGSQTAEARSTQFYLETLGYQTVTVSEEICLWDEKALQVFAEPYAASLAGVVHPAPERIMGSVEEVSEEQWNRALNEGPLSAWCVTKVFCGIMKENGGGSMIYLNSIHAEKPVGNGALFSMGCGAVQMLAREANQDYGQFHVNIFFIQKGISRTDPDGKSPVSNVYYGVDLRYPSRELPPEEYLNGLIAFLLTPEAAPLSGSDLRADGGMTMFYTHRRKVEGRPYCAID